MHNQTKTISANHEYTEEKHFAADETVPVQR